MALIEAGYDLRFARTPFVCQVSAIRAEPSIQALWREVSVLHSYFRTYRSLSIYPNRVGVFCNLAVVVGAIFVEAPSPWLAA